MAIVSSRTGKMPEFWACWPRPTEVLDWAQWGFGFVDFEGWLKRLGVRGVRVGAFSWSEIETAPGKYVFDSRQCPLDDTVNRLVKAGLDIYLNPQLPVPTWAKVPVTLKADNGEFVTIHELPSAACLTSFVQALAKRYGTNVRFWGWGNENDANSDPLGGLAGTDFEGDWTVPARAQHHYYALPFADAVRFIIPNATILGPETMTYGYANAMLLEDNKLSPTQRAFDIVSVHGYAMDGRFPEDALKRIGEIHGSLNDWMKEGGALNGRPLVFGEMGIEHGEDPRGLLTYLTDPRLKGIDIIMWLGLDNFLAQRPPQYPSALPKSLVPNDLYYEVQKLVTGNGGKGVKKKPRLVKK